MAYKIVTDGLVHRWDASTWTSGTTWTDSVGGKNITFSSAPSSVTSDGIELTTSITFTSAALTSLSTTCTLEWVGRIDGNFNNSTPGNVFGWSSSSGGWSGVCCYSKTSSNGVQFDIGSSGTITSGVYTSGIEYHIIVTVNGTTTTCYVNSTTAKGSTTNAKGYAAKTYLYNTEGSGRFYGAISRMCLWNKCLSSTEIATLFEEDVATTTYTVTTSSTGAATISPEGETEVTEGSPFELTIDSSSAVTITDNGTDVTSQLTEKSKSGTVSSMPSAYTTSGTISGTYYTSCIGVGADTSTTSTGNCYASGGSSASAYISYTFDLSSIPSGATIESVSCSVKGHCESTSASSEVAKCQLYTGTTAKGSATSFTSTSDAVITLTTGTWTKDEVDDLSLRFTVGYYGGNVTGATVSITYSVESSGSVYVYTISSVTEAHTIIVSDNATTYDITITSSGTGTTTPTGTKTIAEGGSLTITLTPDSGSSIKTLTKDGVSVISDISQTALSGTATITATTSHGTYSGSIDNILDNSSSTVWWSNDAQSAGSYVLFTFSSPVVLTSVTSTSPSSTSDYVSSGTKLQVSADGMNWTDCGYFSGATTSTVTCSVTSTIQYARFYAATASSNWLYISDVTFAYTVPSQTIYTYTVSNIADDIDIIVVYGTDTVGYIKVSGNWTSITKIYKKVNGAWVEVSTLDTSLHYKKG